MIHFALAANGIQAPASSAAGIVSSLIPLFLIFAVFYFIVILPQQKKERSHRQMLKDLKKGDEVITIGGIHGRIVQADGEILILKVSPQTNLEVSRSAIAHLKNNKKIIKN